MISGSGLLLGPSESAFCLQKLGYSYSITFQSQEVLDNVKEDICNADI